jgi:acetate kinase
MKKLLTLNAGSSSIKFGIFDTRDNKLIEEPQIRGNLSDLDGKATFAAAGPDVRTGSVNFQPDLVSDHETAWKFLLGWLEEALNGAEVIGAGHRIVHGGPKYSAPVKLTEETVRQLAAFTSLAPGHQPHNLAGVMAIARCCPLAKQVACFDTAFHRTQPRIEEMFALPRNLREDGVIRYGFHGLSYEYIAAALGDVLGEYPQRRVIAAHLGAGASMCAIADGKSVATTMGFTALDGLPMATRCGSLDPGVVLHLIHEKRMSVDEVANCLYKESGLLGLSGVSGDMRLLQASESPDAGEAIDFFVRRVVREIGSLAAAMGGFDALVFTAGVGEHSASIRERILTESAWLGFALDEDANRADETRITLAESTPSAWVIPTNEELMIARHTFRLAAQ